MTNTPLWMKHTDAHIFFATKAVNGSTTSVATRGTKDGQEFLFLTFCLWKRKTRYCQGQVVQPRILCPYYISLYLFGVGFLEEMLKQITQELKSNVLVWGQICVK